jgi:hypothetical protein
MLPVPVFLPFFSFLSIIILSIANITQLYMYIKLKNFFSSLGMHSFPFHIRIIVQASANMDPVL